MWALLWASLQYFLLASLVAFVAVHVLGRQAALKPFFATVGPAIFGLGLVQAVICQAGVCYLLLAPFKIWPAAAQLRVSQLCRMAKAVLWPWAFAWCPWISVHVDNKHMWSRVAAQSARPTILISNHTSFMDSILLICQVPLRVAALHVVMMKASLLKIPIFGSVLVSEDHIPVHFSKRGNDDKGKFELAAETRKAMLDKMDDTMVKRQLLCVYPEGTINRGDASKLQQFRAGTFNLAIRHDAAVWGWVAAGNSDAWSATAPVGGQPADIQCGLLALAPDGALAYLKEHGIRLEAAEGQSAEELLKEQSVAMANTLQQTVQKELDRLHALRATRSARAGKKID